MFRRSGKHHHCLNISICLTSDCSLGEHESSKLPPNFLRSNSINQSNTLTALSPSASISLTLPFDILRVDILHPAYSTLHRALAIGHLPCGSVGNIDEVRPILRTGITLAN